STLAHWRDAHGIDGFDEASLAPWFARVEARLAIGPWTVAPNENNEVLRRGAGRLGVSIGLVQRNVRSCWNLGYWRMGCPTNAKQSMLVPTLPAALAAGATLYTRARAQTLVRAGDRVTAVECLALDARGTDATSCRIRVVAPTVVLACGGI